MSMRTTLTPEEEAKIPEIVAQWIAQQTTQTESAKVEEAIKWLYVEKLEMQMPEIILTPSPKAMMEYCKNKLGDANPETMAYGNVSDFGWVAFYDFFDKIGVEVSEDYRQYREYAKAGIYDAVPYDDKIVVSKNPVAVELNADGRPHSVTGPAFLWEDGFGVYYINGRRIDSEWAAKCTKRTLTQKEFLNEKNDELRSAAFEYLGNDFAEFLGASEVDSQTFVHGAGEMETITLIKTKKKLNVVKNEPYAWIKRICPSTGTVYMTPTDPRFTTALEAAKFHRPSWVPQELDYNWISRS